MSDRVKEFIKKIKRSSLQQMRLVNNLLDITRADAGYLRMDMRNLDIVETTRLIIESVIPFARQKGVNLYFSTSLSKKILAMDDEKYERILLNLLSNAIKYTPAGKCINVKIASMENRICISIIDEGPGIPRDKQQVIFEKFGQVGSSLTRKSEGTGIGLCLVKLLVNALGGELVLESDEGMGCCFNILLPISKTSNKKPKDIMPDLMGNRLIENLKVEFSDIYFS